MISNHFLLCKEWNHHPIDSQSTYSNWMAIEVSGSIAITPKHLPNIYPGLGRSRGGHRFAPSGDLETPHRHGQVVPGEVDAAGRKEGGGRVSVVVGLVAALFFFGGEGGDDFCWLFFWVEATKNNLKRYTFLCGGFGK